MRIAAGVLLILISLFSGCRGIFYGSVGAIVSAELSTAQKDAAASPDTVAPSAEEKALADGMVSWGKMARNYGIFLFVLAALQLSGAICLFTEKSKGLVLAVGGLTLLSEGAGVFLRFRVTKLLESIPGMINDTSMLAELSPVGVGVALGAIAGIFAIIGGLSYRSA